MIQAAAGWPKASCHAGSRDWKNSSGWKKVRSVRALTMRRASSREKRPSVESRWLVSDRGGDAGPRPEPVWACCVAVWVSLAGIEQSSGDAIEHDGEDWEWRGRRAELRTGLGAMGGPCSQGVRASEDPRTLYSVFAGAFGRTVTEIEVVV